jgi:hypothetical protein
MKKDYKFEADVRDVLGRKAICDGKVVADLGDLTVFHAVMSEIFQQLTEGKAVYGQPGVGCKGPYTIKKIVIEEA